MTRETKKTVSKLQRDILFGLLLGDLHAEYSADGQKVRFRFEQSVAHRAYMEHLYEIYKDWLPSPRSVDEALVPHRGNLVMLTSYSESFKFYADQFYELQDRKRVKRVPLLIHRWLTARNLAYFYMDDGSMHSSQHKAIIFNTQGFTHQDVERLCQILIDNFGLQAKPRRQTSRNETTGEEKIQWQVRVSGKSFEQVSDLLVPHLIPEMMYKFPPPRKKPEKRKKRNSDEKGT